MRSKIVRAFIRVCTSITAISVFSGCAGASIRNSGPQSPNVIKGTMGSVKGTELVVRVRNLDGSTVYDCQGIIHQSVSQTVGTGWIKADSRGEMHFIFGQSDVAWDLVVTVLPKASSRTGRFKGMPLAMNYTYHFNVGQVPPSPFVIKLDQSRAN